MGVLCAVIFGAIVAGLLAGMVQVQLAIWFGSGEEFIVPLMAQATFVLMLAAVLAAALFVFRTERAVNLVAGAAAATIIAGIASVEAGLLIGDGADAGAGFATDAPILLELVVPMLIAAVIQWWFARRYARRSMRPQAV